MVGPLVDADVGPALDRRRVHLDPQRPAMDSADPGSAGAGRHVDPEGHAVAGQVPGSVVVQQPGIGQRPGSLNVPLGPNGSEFGGIASGGGLYLSTGPGIFAQLAGYF